MEHGTDAHKDQLIMYSLGLLEGQELREMEEHLASGSEVSLQELNEIEMVLSSLAYSLDDSPLSPEVETRILEKIDEQDSRAPKPEKISFWSGIRPMWLNLGSAVAVALLLVLFVNNMSLRNELTIQRQNIEDIQAGLGKDPEVVEYVMNPNVDTIKLESGMPEFASLSGKLLWEVGSKDALLAVSNVPVLEKGKIYQFWLVEEGEKPHSMGTFVVGEDGSKMIEVHCMPEHGGKMDFFITLEPEGGMPQPTGDTYLVGSL